jgi:CDP-diacylglycerol--glycerol-3-phosphate 3-phosphatidyltransferase
MVTYIGLAMHLPITLLIATGHFLWAAVLLVIFGLFDTLDGELARLQKRTSVRGMLLDASTDRFKEVMLYGGAAYWLALHVGPQAAAWATVACGASVCVSYVKAKGEAAVASGDKAIPHATLNRMFADGLLTFELRMAVLVVGLLFGLLAPAVIFIAILASLTAGQRLVRISRQL